MVRIKAELECIVNEKTYRLLCDNDASLEHVKEAIFQFQKQVGNLEDQVKAHKEKMKAEEESKVEPVESPKE